MAAFDALDTLEFGIPRCALIEPLTTIADIENVPIEHLDAFYHKYYQPDNAVLTIAGHFDPDRTLALVTQSLGAIPRNERKLEKTYTVEPTRMASAK